MTVSAQDAHEYPIYNARFRVIAPLLDADGDPISPSSPDTELSQDLGTFADATNEATEIATSSGIVYVDLIATEMDTKSTVVRIQSTGAKTTVIVLNPRRLPVVRTGTAQAGAASTITLDSGASAVDDFYIGCIVNITNDTPSGVRGQARRITDYVGSTKVATIEGTWGTNPSSSSTFEVLSTDEAQGVIHAGTASPDPHTAGYPISTIKDGTGTGEIDTTSGGVLVAAIAANAITATSIATDAITAAKIAADAIGASELADGAITAATFAAGAIDATAIATGAIDADAIAADAIGSSELATSAVDEIVDAVWDELKSGHTTADSFGDYLDDEITSRAAPGAAMDLVADAVDAAAIATGAIDADAIAADAITAAKIANGAIDAATFAAGAIDAAAIAADAVDASALAADALAEIKTQVTDALNVDTYAEIGQETPAATQTIRKMLGFLYKAWRNRATQTATTYSLYNDDATTVAQKATVSDDATTFDKGEIVTGP